MGRKPNKAPIAGVYEIVHKLRVHEIELEMQNEELRTSQRDLDAARERCFDLYDLAPVGYCTVNEEGKIAQANLTLAGLVGLSRNAMANRPFTQLIVRDDQDEYYLHQKRLARSREPVSCELRMRSGNGTAFWARLVATLVEDAAGVPIQRIIVMDITERKRADFALNAKNTELEQARDVAFRASACKSEMLRRLVEQVSGPPKLGNSALRQARDLTAFESVNLALTMGTVSLAHTLERSRDGVGAGALAAGITTNFRLPGGDCLVSADVESLQTVLRVLVENAIQYNRPGGTVEVACESTASPRVRVTVSDTGEGLSADNLGHLFEPFNRLGQERGPRPGVGIGLALAQRLMVAMGGELGVQSTVGVGSQFWIELDRVGWAH